jgi:hypothetical protein
MANDKDADIEPLETSFLSEVKLMINGSRLWSRNKIPYFPLPNQIIIVPEGVSTLDDALFRNFVRDLQASIRFAEDSEWWFFYAGYLSLSHLFNRHVVEHDIWYSVRVLFAIMLVIFYIWCNTFRISREKEINSRIQEWQPWFGNAGFSLEYVVDKPRWWNFTETYLLIEPVAVQEIKSPTANEEAQAKYLVYFARSFVTRNQGSRVLDVKGAGQVKRMVIPKAPALWHLDTQVFSEVMNEAKAESSLTLGKVILGMIGVFCFALILGIILIPKYCLAIIAASGLVLAFAYYKILPALGMYTLPTNKVEEWDQRLRDHGYTLTYHVDEATWWQWHESYLKIQPDKADLPAGHLAATTTTRIV